MKRPFFICVALGMAGNLLAAGSVDLAPQEAREVPGGAVVETYSARTLVVAIEVDRDAARVMSYTIKPRPYTETRRDPADDGRQFDGGSPGTTLEVSLRGPESTIHNRRVQVPFLCLEHGRETDVHIQGDTLRPHRTAVLVELPEVKGFDRIEVTFADNLAGRDTPRLLGADRLDIDRFQRAAGALEYQDLEFADPKAVLGQGTPKGSSVQWPEDFGDTDLYRVTGDASEVDRRSNLVIVPDGYPYDQKGLMEAHADAVITRFQASTPFTEHDAFYNYILVYAYSLESDIDQCDCGITTNNAMGTFFPLSNPTCGNSNNRCIRYGGDPAACDGGGLGNIVSAELRAPAHDSTLIMSNTARYGGCASDRGVFAAAHSVGPDIAVHEAGHSLGGLADEYGGNGCGFGAWEINTSEDAVDGAWSEWIGNVGIPKEGGQTFDSCIYRPTNDCKMIATASSFCPVCTQWWTLRTFGDPRIAPTAPVESFSPPLLVQVQPGDPVGFDVTPRLPGGPGVQNGITWSIEGPGFPDETEVATGVTSYARTFADEGQYLVRCEVIAGMNFVKPSRYQDNAETLTWQVEVSSAPAEEVLVPIGFVSNALIVWDQVPGVSNNVYRGTLSALPGDYGTCFAPNVPWSNSFVFDPEIPPPGTVWTYLITGISAAGEGSLGFDSYGNLRVNNNPCSDTPASAPVQGPSLP